MKLSDITFQNLTIYDKATMLSWWAYMLRLRNEYHTVETVKCHRCQIKLYISTYKRYER